MLARISRMRPVRIFRAVQLMKPAAMPTLMLNVSGMRISVSTAGISSSIRENSRWRTFLNMKTPAMTRAGAVAKAGTAWMTGESRRVSAKQAAVTSDASPVRAPAEMPVAHST